MTGPNSFLLGGALGGQPMGRTEDIMSPIFMGLAGTQQQLTPQQLLFGSPFLRNMTAGAQPTSLDQNRELAALAGLGGFIGPR